ncbi:MAG: glycosyltransferase [Acidobacteria bacterium]|nr:MAG: glycosyltransferase [Acidobacteriota bacterium]
MARIQMITCHPARLVASRRIRAANYRAEQFLDSLLADGHEILLCSGSRDEEPSTSASINSDSGRLLYQHIPYGSRAWVSSLQKSHDRFSPDCVIAINYSHCLYATRLKTDRPIWMDLCGDMITKQHAHCHRFGTNRDMPTTLTFMRQILGAGDIFSACSQPQRNVLVGELAMSGRLNHRNFGYEFTRIILPGSPQLLIGNENRRRHRSHSKLGLAPDDFVVLWCGGYSTRADVDTLFYALEWAMERHPKLHFVSVGASTYDAPENAYTRLLTLIDGSPFRDRYHMQGWQPWEEIPRYYAESHVGLNIEAMHYETIYGTRTRLVEMIAAGLPVITTEGTQLSYLLQASRAAMTCEVGRWDELGSQILRLASDEGLREEISRAALHSSQSEFSFAKTTECLRTWVKSPTMAPDRRPASKTEKLEEVRHRAYAVIRRLLWKLIGTDSR